MGHLAKISCGEILTAKKTFPIQKLAFKLGAHSNHRNVMTGIQMVQVL
jgi:hypothetical protein